MCILSIISHYIIYTVHIDILIRIRQVATLFFTARHNLRQHASPASAEIDFGPF